MSRRSHFLALTALLAAAGCGQPATGRLMGTIRLEKNPLKVANIVVYSEDGKRSASGAVIADDGTYLVDKAPAGKVKIAITVPTAQELLPPPGPEDGLPGGKKAPPQGGNADGSFPPEVRAHLTQLAKKVIPIPSLYGNAEKSGLSTTVEANGDTLYDIVLKR